MKIKIAQIGLGKAFYLNNKKFKTFTHSYTLKSLKNFDLVHAIDLKKNKRIVAKKMFNCETYLKIKSLKNKEFDLIVLSTPKSLHLKNFLQILNVLKKPPKILLIEKPVGASLKEAKSIMKICKQNKILAFVNYFREYDPIFFKIKDFFKKNSNSTVEYSGNFMDNASHFISLFLRIFGHVKKIKIIKKTKLGNDFFIDFLLYFKNNNICNFKSRVKSKNYHSFCIKNPDYNLKYNNYLHTAEIIKNKNNLTKKYFLNKNFTYVYKNIYNFFSKKKYLVSSVSNAVEVHKIMKKCLVF